MRLVEKTVGKIESKLLSVIDSDVDSYFPQIPVVYLEGGHYDPRYPVTEFSIDSLHKALSIANNSIVKHKKKLKVVLGILIDDLGLQCGSDSCDISVHSSVSDEEDTDDLPAALENVLAQYSIVKRDRVMLQGERNCKNRGIQSLKRIIAQHKINPRPELFVEEAPQLTQVFFKNAQDQSILLAESKNKDIWTAKCPLIMAQHYSDIYQKVSKLHPQTSAYHIIDFSEIDDYHKVITGAEVAMKIFLRNEQTEGREMQVTNIFLSDFDQENHLINTVSNKSKTS